MVYLQEAACSSGGQKVQQCLLLVAGWMLGLGEQLLGAAAFQLALGHGPGLDRKHSRLLAAGTTAVPGGEESSNPCRIWSDGKILWGNEYEHMPQPCSVQD